MRPFTPRQKDNLAAWMVARNDGAHYGQLAVYRFPRQSLVFGPNQIVNRINQDTEVSRQITLWDQRGSEVLAWRAARSPNRRRADLRAAVVSARAGRPHSGAQARRRRARRSRGDGRDVGRGARGVDRGAPAATSPTLAAAIRRTRAPVAATGANATTQSLTAQRARSLRPSTCRAARGQLGGVRRRDAKARRRAASNSSKRGSGGRRCHRAFAPRSSGRLQQFERESSRIERMTRIDGRKTRAAERHSLARQALFVWNRSLGMQMECSRASVPTENVRPGSWRSRASATR